MKSSIEVVRGKGCHGQKCSSRFCLGRGGKIRVFTFLVTVFLALGLCSCGNIISSAKNGDLEGIERSLNDGVSIETKTENGSTPLIVAAYSRRPSTVTFLLEHGADVNAMDNNHSTALIHAAYYNFYEVAEVLVTYNADLTIRDRFGNTAYDYASQYEHTRILELLKKKLAEKPAIAKPAATVPAETGRRFTLCIFPWEVGGGTMSTSRALTRKAVKAIMESLANQKQVVLTHCYYQSEIPEAFRDHFQDADFLQGVNHDQVWTRKNAFSQSEPDKAFIVQKGKEIGVDLGLLVKSRHQSQAMWGVSVYLVDMNKGTIQKSGDSVYWAVLDATMQNKVRDLLEEFLSANE